MDSRLRRAAYLGGGGGSTSSVEPPSTGVLVSALSSSYASTKKEYSAVLEGRVSLAALEGIILAMIVFYIWTRGIQGGG